MTQKSFSSNNLNLLIRFQQNQTEFLLSNTIQTGKLSRMLFLYLECSPITWQLTKTAIVFVADVWRILMSYDLDQHK